MYLYQQPIGNDRKKTSTPPKIKMSPEQGPSKKESIVFQPSIFKCYDKPSTFVTCSKTLHSCPLCNAQLAATEFFHVAVQDVL